eukprot:5158038-Lingulodinium_polyedra.AAC.1
MLRLRRRSVLGGPPPQRLQGGFLRCCLRGVEEARVRVRGVALRLDVAPAELQLAPEAVGGRAL